MEPITPDDFDGNIFKKKNCRGIVLFYMEWCPYCKMVLPTLENYSKKGGRVYIMEGETGNNQVIFDKFGIRPVPDIRVLREDGSLSNRYDGGRELSDFEKLVPIKRRKARKNPGSKTSKKPQKVGVRRRRNSRQSRKRKRTGKRPR